MSERISSKYEDAVIQAAHAGVSVDEMAGRLGLSVAEFSRYAGLGIIKIRVVEATGDNGVSEVVVQLGNKVLIAVVRPILHRSNTRSDFCEASVISNE